MSTTPEQPTPSELPSAPAMSEADTLERAGYKPLAAVAVASFGLAVLFALTIVGGTLAALITRSPLLLPPWLLLLGLAILLLAGVAQLQIRNSEGTLTGLSLARWAMGLSLVLTPLYGAYYAATYFAVTAQAQDFSRRWLKLITDGELEQAFWMTVPPGQRPRDDQRSRDALEVQFNQPDRDGRGQFAGFCASDLTRFLRNGGKNPTIELVTISDWVYEHGGYRVLAVYKITSNLATFQAAVAAQGVTASTGDLRGRQWTIVQQSTGLVRTVESLPKFSAEGEKYGKALEQSRGLADLWTRAVASGYSESAFALTWPPEDVRSWLPLQSKLVLTGLVTGPTPPTATERKILLARNAWFGEGFLDADPKRFWTTQPARAAILAAVKKALKEGPSPGGRVSLAQQVSLPQIVQVEGGAEYLGYDVQLLLPRPGVDDPPFAVDAQLLIRLKRNDKGQAEVDGIERLELLAGRSMASGGPPGRR